MRSARLIELVQASVIPTEVAFLSPDIYDSAFWARERLALTYFPRFRSRFRITPQDFLVRDNTGNTVAEDQRIDTIPRVWPAFGRRGGAHEILVTWDTKSLPEVTPDPHHVILFDGGKFDPYSQDNVQDYDFELAIEIAQGIRDAIGQTEAVRGEDRVFGKVTEDSFVVVTITSGKRHYSLSTAYKLLGNLVRLKFWGYVWYDDMSLRHLYGPLTEVVAVDPIRQSPGLPEHDVKDRLRHRLKLHQYPYHVISGAAKNILKRATRIDDRFLSIYSSTFPL
jgi:hypothetical protein